MTRHGNILNGLIWCCLILFLSSCARINLYSIDMKYVPTKTVTQPQERGERIDVTVANFVDSRQIEDLVVIGRVVQSDGSSILVFPKKVKPAEVVTGGIRAFLSKSGYTVSGNIPVWDLEEKSIQKDWGKLLIGGRIDELEVSCKEITPKKMYQARVKLTVFFANPRDGKIFYKVSTNSSSSLEHILFSEERLEEQINGALSEAIEKVFEGKELQRKIRDTLERVSP